MNELYHLYKVVMNYIKCKELINANTLEFWIQLLPLSIHPNLVHSLRKKTTRWWAEYVSASSQSEPYLFVTYCPIFVSLVDQWSSSRLAIYHTGNRDMARLVVTQKNKTQYWPFFTIRWAVSSRLLKKRDSKKWAEHEIFMWHILFFLPTVLSTINFRNGNKNIR